MWQPSRTTEGLSGDELSLSSLGTVVRASSWWRRNLAESGSPAPEFCRPSLSPSPSPDALGRRWGWRWLRPQLPPSILLHPPADPSSSTSTRTTSNDRGRIRASWVSIYLLLIGHQRGGRLWATLTPFGWSCSVAGHAVRPQACQQWGSVPFAFACRGQLRHVCEVWARACWRGGFVFVSASQRSLVNATASTSATSWVIACWWCRCAPPISRASPAMAPCGVAVIGSSPRPDGCLPVCASLRRGRVQVWLRTVWRRPTRLGIFVGARLPPPRAKSGRGSARCGGGQHPPPCLGENAFACLPSSQASPVWLRAERRRLTFAGALLPSSRATPKGSAWCGGGRLPPQSLVGLWRLWQRF